MILNEHGENLRRKRILMVAYACRPNTGSEPGIGWSFAEAVSRHHDLWVLTRRGNRKAIELHLLQIPNANLHVVYGREPGGRLSSRLFGGWRRRYFGYYYFWNLVNRATVRKLQKQHGFEIAHHVTYGRYWNASCVGALNTARVLGPLGGGEDTPAALARESNIRQRLLELMRRAARSLGEKDPLVRRMLRDADCVLVTTEATARRVEKIGSPRAKIFPQVVLNDATYERLSLLPLPSSRTARFLSSGRHLHWKGFELGVRAFARICAERTDVEYVLVGTGPELERLRKVTRELGCHERVTFLGMVTLPEVFAILGTSHVLVHPSMHEAFGAACVEAQAAGRPVICLNAGGPAVIVSDRTGFRVPIGDVDSVIAGIAEAMNRLADDRLLLEQMGEAARVRSREEFTWSTRLPDLELVYDTVTRPAAPTTAFSAN